MKTPLPTQNWLQNLQQRAAKESRLVAGIMSGTSSDGVDVAICQITGAGIATAQSTGAAVKLIKLYSHPYPTELQKTVRSNTGKSWQQFSDLNYALGDLFAESCLAAIKAAGITNEQLDIIGSHGQTVYHHSQMPGAARTSLQLGCGDRIAERTKVAVFSDLRARDLAAGGEGAPLTPYADAILYSAGIASTAMENRAVLNLGGIANITLLSADSKRIIGFDTGPANAPLDRLVRIISNNQLQHDEDGKLAASGKCNDAVLQQLLQSDLYIQRPPPKSSGFEAYGDQFVADLIQRCGGATADALATAVEFVVAAVHLGIKQSNREIKELILAGGGAHNSYLIARLKAKLTTTAIRSSSEFGVPVSAREAMAFAIFANDALCGVPTSLPSVTGASGPRILGKLSLPL